MLNQLLTPSVVVVVASVAGSSSAGLDDGWRGIGNDCSDGVDDETVALATTWDRHNNDVMMPVDGDAESRLLLLLLPTEVPLPPLTPPPSSSRKLDVNSKSVKFVDENSMSYCGEWVAIVESAHTIVTGVNWRVTSNTSTSFFI